MFFLIYGINFTDEDKMNNTALPLNRNPVDEGPGTLKKLVVRIHPKPQKKGTYTKSHAEPNEVNHSPKAVIFFSISLLWHYPINSKSIHKK